MKGSDEMRKTREIGEGEAYNFHTPTETINRNVAIYVEFFISIFVCKNLCRRHHTQICANTVLIPWHSLHTFMSHLSCAINSVKHLHMRKRHAHWATAHQAVIYYRSMLPLPRPCRQSAHADGPCDIISLYNGGIKKS